MRYSLVIDCRALAYIGETLNTHKAHQTAQEQGNTEGRQVQKKHTMTQLTNEQKAYIAGFLDGDGCLNAQIVPRQNYKLQYQIRVTLTFFQKTKRHWILLQLYKLLKLGTIRKRNDGMSEYAIVGKTAVKKCVQILYPYLRVKKLHARRVLQIISHLKRDQDPQAFLKLCEVVDTFQDLNDSKKRTLTSQVVRSHFLQCHLLPVPVETI